MYIDEADLTKIEVTPLPRQVGEIQRYVTADGVVYRYSIATRAIIYVRKETR